MSLTSIKRHFLVKPTTHCSLTLIVTKSSLKCFVHFSCNSEKHGPHFFCTSKGKKYTLQSAWLKGMNNKIKRSCQKYSVTFPHLRLNVAAFTTKRLFIGYMNHWLLLQTTSKFTFGCFYTLIIGLLFKKKDQWMLHHFIPFLHIEISNFSNKLTTRRNAYHTPPFITGLYSEIISWLNFVNMIKLFS